MNREIKKIIPPKLPFDEDDKIFIPNDDEGNQIGEPYSYNDFIKEFENISGVNEDFMGEN